MPFIDVEISGMRIGLLMHRLPESAEAALQGNSRSSIRTTKGTPREQAAEFLYQKDGKLYIPGSTLFSALIGAGIFHKIGRKQVTTRDTSLVPAGLSVLEEFCWLNTDKWEVDSRPIVNQTTGNRQICHRPRIDDWKTSFTIEYDEEMFSEDLVRALVDDAGKKHGIGAFRPQRKGPFGRFVVTRWVVKPSEIPEEGDGARVVATIGEVHHEEEKRKPGRPRKLA